MRSGSPRINIRVFTAFLVVGLLMLTVASAFVLGIGAGRLRDSYGANLAKVADHTVAAVDAYVFRRIIDASILGSVPDIRDVAASGSKRAFDAGAVRDLEQRWTKTPEVPRRSMSCSRARLVPGRGEQGRCGLSELFVTDRFGRLVVPRADDRLLPGGRGLVAQAFGDGARAAGRGDVRCGEREGVCVGDCDARHGGVGRRPGRHPQVVADIREIGTAVSGVRLGTTGGANLPRERSFVFSRELLDPSARYFATDCCASSCRRSTGARRRVG
jgi:hypothetical protein